MFFTKKDIKEFTAYFNKEMPVELQKIYMELNGFSGLVGNSYISVFSVGDLKHFNQEYQVETNLPGYLIFASDGGGESYGFYLNEPFLVYKIPFIPMVDEYKVLVAKNADEFFKALGAAAPMKHMSREKRKDYEIFEIQPIIFGGSPTDKRNKIIVDRNKHFELVRFWNKKYRELKAEN